MLKTGTIQFKPSIGGGNGLGSYYVKQPIYFGMVGGSDGSSGTSKMLTYEEMYKMFEERSPELYPELTRIANIVMGRAAIRGVKYDKDEYIKEIKEYNTPEAVPGEHRHLTTQEFAQRINAAGLTKEDLLNIPKGEMVSYFVMREIKKIIERNVDKDFPPGSQISIELHGPPPPPPPPPETNSGMDRAERRELWRLIFELASQYEEEETDEEVEDEPHVAQRVPAREAPTL